MNKGILYIIAVLCMSANLCAKPRWVGMMQQDNTHYFKAVKRFERYWQKHFLPNQEQEEHVSQKKEEEEDPRPWLTKLVQSEEKAKEKSNRLTIEYKKFNKWKMEMLPYVKANGRLLSTEERLEAWKQLQKM